MNWFLAKLVFRVVCGDGKHPAQFDEQVRLLSATDEFHAFHEARLLGESECSTVTRVVNGPAWKFMDVTELHVLSPLADGAEIYSSVREEPQGDLYIRKVKKDAAILLQRSLHAFTAQNETLIGS